MIHKANIREDGYCYFCREDIESEELKQCGKCKNWFCEKDIVLVENPDSISIENILLCSKDRGEPGFM